MKTDDTSGKKLAVLMTCHNRREKTFRSLAALFSALPEAELDASVHLVDDGSSDGTGDAVRQAYPSVSVITGDGPLFWTRGMRTAWEDALKKDADFYLWLNDDTVLHPFAVSHLLEASLRMEHAAVICGSTCHPGTDEWTYGGTAGGKPVIPDGTLRECELCHGNILWVPRRVVERIGILDGFYLHALGDYDYSRTARERGIKLRVAPACLGTCERHDKAVAWTDRKVPLAGRLRNLYSPLGNAQPRYYFHYVRRHDGLLAACKAMICMHVRVFLPFLWTATK